MLTNYISFYFQCFSLERAHLTQNIMQMNHLKPKRPLADILNPSQRNKMHSCVKQCDIAKNKMCFRLILFLTPPPPMTVQLFIPNLYIFNMQQLIINLKNEHPRHHRNVYSWYKNKQLPCSTYVFICDIYILTKNPGKIVKK